MTIRDHEMKARRFEFDEARRKMRDLGELKRHLESSRDRLVGDSRDGESAEDRRLTLQASIDDIERQLVATRVTLDSSREAMESQELVRNGYDRIPVAVGSRRGRGQVEHIRIVRTHRS